MRSFAAKVKNELCRVPISRSCCARAEAYGVLLYCNTFTPSEVRIITENEDFASRLPRLFQKAFAVKFDRLPVVAALLGCAVAWGHAGGSARNGVRSSNSAWDMGANPTFGKAPPPFLVCPVDQLAHNLSL